MSQQESKLNRSHSDSDLYNALWENSSVENFEFDKTNPPGTLIRRAVYVEEIISPDCLNSFTRCTTFRQVTAHHSVHNLDNLEQTFKNIAIDSFQNRISAMSTTSPMDVDNHYDAYRLKNELDTTETDGCCINSGSNFHKNIDHIRNYDTYRSRNVFGKTHENTNIEPSGKFGNLYDHAVGHTGDFRPSNELDITYESNFDKTKNFVHDSVRKDGSNEPTSYTGIRHLGENQTKLIYSKPEVKKDAPNLLVTMLLLSTAVVFGIFVYKGYNFISVNNDVVLDNIRKDLLDNIHEQNGLINTVVHSLEQRSRWTNKVKVLGFVGSQGVGKTFAANLIKKHFAQKLVHDIDGVHLNYDIRRDNILKSLDDCCLNLIVVHDLRMKDNVEFFAFVHSLPKDQFILVISIFNIRYTDDDLNTFVNYDDIINIRNEFDRSGTYNELVVFRDFSDSQIKDWLKKQLALHNVSSSLFDQILESVLKGHNTKHGLKGLYSKMLLELQRHNR